MLLLEPFKGKIPPKSHINIKMTLKASLLPSAYEGEIECQVNWMLPEGDDAPPQSGEAPTASEEFLYLRIKKHPVIVSFVRGSGG